MKLATRLINLLLLKKIKKNKKIKVNKRESIVNMRSKLSQNQSIIYIW